MTEDSEKLDKEVDVKEPDEEVLIPTNKYERVMIAALEATRLNEEIQRKGIKLPNKVTTEAINRVRDGKVKAVITRPSSILDRPTPAAAAPPEPTRDSLFAPPPPEAEPAGGANGDESDEKPSAD